MQIAKNTDRPKAVSHRGTSDSLCKTAMLFKFACYFPAEEPLFIPINIESDAWTVELLDTIQMELKSHDRDVRLRDLRVFKVNLFFLLHTSN